MAITDPRPADRQVFQSALFDQGASTQATRVAEDAAGGLIGERLGGPLHNPDLLHPRGQIIAVIRLERLT